jgi:uncharacterized membrane protein
MASMAAVLGVAAVDALAGIQVSRRARTEARRERAIRLTQAVTVNRPPEEVYRFWRDFRNLPQFMAHVDSIVVEAQDDRRSRWTARLLGGKTVAWDAQITEDRPNERIAWRSLPGADIDNAGSVRFVRAPGGPGTEIHVDIQYLPPAGFFGVSLAKLFGKVPEQQVVNDLRRLKQVLETGEVVHSDASIHSGPHPARPPKEVPARLKGGRS